MRLPLAIGLTLVLLLACSAPSGSAAPVAADTVNLPPSYRFEPEAITVPAGTTVTWTNNDNFTHNVRLEGEQPLTMRPAESVTYRFDQPGTYAYVCSLHPNDMQGSVLVTED